MKKPLVIKAGATALATIKKEGLSPSLFSSFFGASGGPKWLALSRMDQVIAEQFISKSDNLSLLGTSIGSWRMAAHAHPDALATLKRFEDNYVNAWSSDDWQDPSAMEHAMLSGLHQIFGDEGAKLAIDNDRFELNIIADRCRGPLASESKLALIPSMAAAYAANRISRENLKYFYERVQFSNRSVPALTLNQLPTTYAKLDETNLFKVIAASSSIPFVMNGVQQINHAQPGVYRDGGITDYHFDFDYNAPKGLTLFMHFYDTIVPGWLDKGNKKRTPTAKHLDKVLFISPSKEWIASAPKGKIPDRNDFTRLSGSERKAYWQQFIGESQRLGDSLSDLLASDSPEQMIELI